MRQSGQAWCAIAYRDFALCRRKAAIKKSRKELEAALVPAKQVYKTGSHQLLLDTSVILYGVSHVEGGQEGNFEAIEPLRAAAFYGTELVRIATAPSL